MTDETYRDLGRALVARRGPGERYVLLHVAATDNVLDTSIFRIVGNEILMEFTDNAMKDLIWDILDPIPEDERWSGMYFLVDGQEFRTEFVYPDQRSFDQVSDTREETVARFFGPLPIRYSGLFDPEPWDGS